MRTYRTAHALAARGHDVHVVTNAKEARPPFRMHMRAEDWERCEAQSATGSVKVHWTDPVDRSQSYLPMASPFVSKLAAVAARAHAAHRFDVIHSHYMEPYGIAGYLASQMTGVPHVVRMAGSDAGRLWHHPQFEALYDHVLRSADVVVAVGAVADRAVQHGVDPRRIAAGGGYALPEDSFTPQGPALDFEALRAELRQDTDLQDLMWGGFAADRPTFGVYGKLGEKKGSLALLAALQRLKRDGMNVGLVAMAHGRPEIEQRFRERASELGLTDRVLQIPFLPHWRVPEFLRGCLAVCCLEQDFPIGLHSPIVPFEVLLSGSCLVGSTEVIRKLPQWERLPHGYGCVAIEDVNDIDELSGRLAAIVREPRLAAVVGARGRAFAREAQADIEFPQRLEHILEAAANRRAIAPSTSGPAAPNAASPDRGRFPLTRIAMSALSDRRKAAGLDNDGNGDADDLAHAQQVLARLEKTIAGGREDLRSLAQAVRVEIAVARAEDESARCERPDLDPLFRLRLREWAMGARELGGLAPVRDSRLRILQFDQDVSEFWGIRTLADFPASMSPGPSHIVVFGKATMREPLLVDRFTARILELSDGTRTGDEIVRQLDRQFGRSAPLDHLAWIENLFLSGLVEFISTDT
jgi:glycosyltransferase involved in cell wall biosynthesis